MRTLLKTRWALTFMVALVSAAFGARAATPRLGYRMICHPNNPIDVVDRQFLEDVFLKRVRAWPGGGAIRPVDLAPSAPVRRTFSEEVLRRSVDEVRSYWQQRIFSGRELPPPEVNTDEDVVRYVLKDRGAVGYVLSDAPLDGAKVLAIR